MLAIVPKLSIFAISGLLKFSIILSPKQINKTFPAYHRSGKSLCQSTRSASSYLVVHIWTVLLQLEYVSHWIVSSLMRLNQEDLVRMLRDYHAKFNNILDELKNDLSELKSKFCKLEFDRLISRNVYNKSLWQTGSSRTKIPHQWTVLQERMPRNFRHAC